MKIEIMSLKIYNFKGIKELYIDLSGKDCNIRGENATGKTSVKDAFTWLLFGKDSFGRADFGIKPLDANGDVIHQLETSVESIMLIDGKAKKFKRTLNEVWTRKRGAAEATFTRNEIGYYIDDVSKKKTEFTAEIGSLIKEDIFKVVTDPLFFNESLAWKERRAILIETCGNITDEDVIASNKDLAPLISLLDGKNVDDYKAILVSTMKNINGDLERIPIQINEAELAKPSEEELEIDYMRKDMLTQSLEQEQVRRNDIVNGNHITEEKRNLHQLYSEVGMLGMDSHIENTEEYKQMGLIKDRLFREKEQRLTIIELTDKLELKIKDTEEARKDLSEEWDAVFNERFTDTICPTCHRELPENEVEERRKEFNYKKACRLDELERENKKFKELLEQDQSELKAKKERLSELDSNISDLDSSLRESARKVNELIEANEKAVEEKRVKLTAEIEATKQRIAEYERNSEGLITEIDVKIEKIQSELSQINEAVANKALLQKQEERIAELKRTQEYLAREYTKNEKNLYLVECFITTKVDMLNERINQKFKHAKFKLFDKQINGGINEVCEVTYNGVPYKDLNNAMRINVGLDVINTISEYYGVTAPIIIDNAESVNQLFDTNAQQICMYVSKDKKLTFDMK